MSIKEFTDRWSKQHPLDYWWRKKNNVAFGSPAHREMTFFAMRVEYEESLAEEAHENAAKHASTEQDDADYYQVTGTFIKPLKQLELDDTAVEDIYEKLDINDLSQFDDKPSDPEGVIIE